MYMYSITFRIDRFVVQIIFFDCYTLGQKLFMYLR